MSDIKVFLYELRRLLFTKVYAGFLIITAAYAYYDLSNKIILGVADTAPFSQWSYSAFLCDLNPLLLMLLLFFCTYVYSKKERAVRTITLATRLMQARYFCLKGAAILAAWLLAAMTVVAISFVFYALVFRCTGFAVYIEPIALFLLPPAVFIFGVGMIAGRRSPALLYVLIPVTFMLALASIGGSVWADPFCGTVASSYPLALQADAMGDVPYMLPSGMALSRTLYMAVGAALFAAVCLLRERNQIKNQMEEKK